MKFDFCIGNPPYQEETAKKETTNGQKRSKSIFHYFQIAADQITQRGSVLIYPGVRWIHQSGKGMAEFGKKQINDITLSRLDFYPDSKDLFPNADIADGISIVAKRKEKKSEGFLYNYITNDTCISVQRENPKDSLMSLNPQNESIDKKIKIFVSDNKINYLNKVVLSQKLFGVESDFVEKNPDKVRKWTSDLTIDYNKEIKLFTNDKSGKAGRSKWYIVDRNVIKTNTGFINEWQVIVSSANAGGQKRDNQIEIVDNHSAFGRSRVALRSFKTKEEAENFFKYCQSYIVRYAFLLTDEALTSLGKKVPDLIDYTNNNKLIDFSRNIDAQLKEKMEISDTEFLFIKDTVDNIRKKD